MLYVCRANFREYSESGSVNHGKHPGKVVDGRCNFGFGGRREIIRRFRGVLSESSLIIATNFRLSLLFQVRT
jgi:hypothetical protein